MDAKEVAGADKSDSSPMTSSGGSNWSQLQAELIREAVASKDWGLLEKYRQISEEMAKGHRNSVNDVRSSDIPECPRSLIPEANSSLPLDVDYSLYPERQPGFWKHKSVITLGQILMRFFYAEAYCAYFIYLFRDNNKMKRSVLPVNNTYLRISLWEASSIIAPLEKVLEEISRVNLAHFELIPFLKGDTASRSEMKSESFYSEKYTITSAGRSIMIRPFLGDTGYGFAIRSVVPTTILVGGKVWIGPQVFLRMSEAKAFVSHVKEFIREVEQQELSETVTTSDSTVQQNSPSGTSEIDDQYGGFSLNDLSWPAI